VTMTDAFLGGSRRRDQGDTPCPPGLARVTPIPAPIRRLLLEGRDQALRIARARACDAGG
jgi:hypothetical protein